MNLLYSRKHADGVDLVYQQADQSLGIAADLSGVRRTILGIRFPVSERANLPAYGYVCVIAERVWYSSEENAPTSQYVLVDEAEVAGGSTFFDAVVNMKDKYCAVGVHCPNNPPRMVEALRNHEGLCYYPDLDSRMLRERYANFVGRDIVSLVSDDEMPDEGTVQSDVDSMLSTEVTHPDDPALPLWGAGGNDPMKRFVVLGNGPEDNFTTQTARQALAIGDMAILSAIWLAMMGAERTGALFGGRYVNKKQMNRTKSITGY